MVGQGQNGAIRCEENIKTNPNRLLNTTTVGVEVGTKVGILRVSIAGGGRCDTGRRGVAEPAAIIAVRVLQRRGAGAGSVSMGRGSRVEASVSRCTVEVERRLLIRVGIVSGGCRRHAVPAEMGQRTRHLADAWQTNAAQGRRWRNRKHRSVARSAADELARGQAGEA